MKKVLSILIATAMLLTVIFSAAVVQTGAAESSSGGSSSSDGSGDSSYSLNPYCQSIDYSTPYGQFCSYLTDGGFMEDLRIYRALTDQEIIDAAAAKYGLYRDDVELALRETYADSVAWKASESTLRSGKSGLTYVEGAYYLLTSEKNINNVDKNLRLKYRENSGYYIISEVSVYEGEPVEVARYDGNRKFTVVSREPLYATDLGLFLFFFRPESDGYKFGFNTGTEYDTDNGIYTADAHSGVIVSSIEDTVSGPKLTWEKVSGVATYRVFVHRDGKWTKLGDTKELSFVHTSAQNGGIYRYTVRGIGSDGKFCTKYDTNGWYHRFITAPQITAVENTADGALIKWDPVDCNARYRVYVKNGITWDTLGDTYDTSFLHSVKKADSVPGRYGVPSDIKTYPKLSDIKIYFDSKTTGWNNFDTIAFHIWSEDDLNFNGYDWGSKKENGTDEGNGIWSFDVGPGSRCEIRPGYQYTLVVYSKIEGSAVQQTYNLLMGTPCLGHTAYCDETIYENPSDSNKTTQAAFWDSGVDYTEYGPELTITSIGNVVGSCIPSFKTPYDMFVDYLRNTLSIARWYSGRSDQQLIDDVARALGLSDRDVERAIRETGVRVAWDSSENTCEADSIEDGSTYRYLVRCVSYDGYKEIGAYDNTGVANTFIKPVSPTVPETTPPTDPVPQVMRGDYDGDNDITIMDATRVQNILADLATRPILSILTALDADGDGELTILDATRVQNVVAQLMTMDGVKL